MIKNEKGFSLVELLIVMLILGFVLAATSDMFVSLLRGYKQQSKIAETNIEGMIGLELLRRDIESAGYGLPYDVTGASYLEATNAVALNYNDQPSNPPRAFVAGDNITVLNYVNGSDYLVIKAINVAMNDTSTLWTNGTITAFLVSTMTWSTLSSNLTGTDRCIVIAPGSDPDPDKNSKLIVVAGGSFYTQFNNLSAFLAKDETRLIYGVDPDTNLRMPFNRADYYVSTTTASSGRCAPGTGIFKKAVVSQSDGGFSGTNIYELLDCVADMQVVFGLDRDEDGTAESYSPFLTNISTGVQLTAALIRAQVKEVRVYILTHEGQRDSSYIHPTTGILVGEVGIGGRTFNIGTNVNYRWKVYTLNMRVLL